MTNDGRGAFVFEDERGKADVARPRRSSTACLPRRPSGVRFAFFNGCKTSQAASAGLCQSLVAAGVPLAVGWSASVADDRATDFADEFYRRLVRGEPVPAAAAHARQAVRHKGIPPGQHRPPGRHVRPAPALRPGRRRPPLRPEIEPRAVHTGPRTRYVLLGDGIKGLGEGFIGRRREIHRLVPALRDGSTTFAVLTGIGGRESTLATRAANRLAAGFRAVPILREARPAAPARPGRAWSPASSARSTMRSSVRTATISHGQITDGKLLWNSGSGSPSRE